MDDYSKRHVHVEDNGIFTELAIALAKHFGKVTYSTPWRSAFPSSMQTEIGEGINEIERVPDITQVFDQADLFIFPDIYASDAQIYLSDTGARVWGSRNGDELERFRGEAKRNFEKLQIPIGPYEQIQGISRLRTYIKTRAKTKLWVKIDDTRGDTETFCSESYDLIKNRLDDLEFRLGPKSEIMNFIVEDNLDETIDIAIDTFCIDGNYPDLAVLGMEEKGECYIGVRKRMADMPAGLTSIYSSLSDILRQYQYRNFLSLESRIKRSQFWLCDPCCRGGSPPLELQLEWIKNLPDILWYGAEGVIVEPQMPGKYGVELIIHSDWVCDNPLMLEFPKNLRDKIKLRYNSEFDGQTWIMSQKAGPRIAAVVEYGDDIDNLIEKCKHYSSQIKGFKVESFTRSFPIALDKIKQLKSWGITF